MNKNYIIIAAVVVGIIVIAGGGFFFLNQNSTNNSEDEMMAADEQMMNEDAEMENDAMMEEDEMMMEEGSSKYIVHTPGIVEDTNGSERVLYFYANWCPTCRPIDTELSENEAQIPDGITIIRVNYNDPETDEEEEDLADLYGINYQHTFVHIDENGNEISTWSGGGLEELIENIN